MSGWRTLLPFFFFLGGAIGPRRLWRLFVRVGAARSKSVLVDIYSSFVFIAFIGSMAEVWEVSRRCRGKPQ
jgi:hypothetical protein